ncbi:hypothetical protein VKT23_005490 [Stygiomarasmius scandens]|uniref:Uncharacterized protein n=1 Tax=Marasmiellus scandens TaxID=2682957 RepID=A0ABR1JQX5_9AGAR
MAAVSNGGPNVGKDILIRCAGFFVGSVGFALSVLAALLHLVYVPPQNPEAVEYKRRPSSQVRRRSKRRSTPSSDNTTHSLSTPRSSYFESKSDSSPPHSAKSEKAFAREQVVFVTRPSVDLDTPTTLDSGNFSSEESPTDASSRRKLCTCRAKDPSKKCSGKCLFKVLRKTPSEPSCLSPPCVSSASKKKSQPRLRTQPYEAPYFLPTPDSVPRRPSPMRAQTMPPPQREVPKMLERSAVTINTEIPSKSPPKEHVRDVLPPGTTRR